MDHLSRTFRRVMLALWCGLIASAAPADTSQCIRIFDATAYIHKPDFAHIGLQAGNVFEPDRFWPRGASHDDLPDPGAAGEWLRRIRTKHGLLILDVERWWLRGNDADVKEAMRRYLTVFDWIRSAGYAEPMGYYGTIPTYNAEASLQDVGSRARAVWQKENDRIQPLADRVDVLFPSLYTADGDVDTWEKRAIATLHEARRIAKGKPIYPFLWPQYEGAKNPLGLHYMPRSEWARELQVVGDNADGMVIWGGIELPGTKGPPEWDESAPWWQATLAFIAHQHLCSDER